MHRLRTYLARRRDRATLHAMDADQLNDLGITRDQIEAYLDGALQPDKGPVADIIPFPPERICCDRSARAA